jgi:hypothetical protein
MGFSGGLLTAAAINDQSRALARDHRADLARGSLTWLVDLAATCWPGRPAFVMQGARDRDSRHLRQVAIYLAHTALQIEEQVCATVFQLHKSQATRAVQAIEARRQEFPEFDSQLEQLEAVIRRWLMSARSVGPVPPTQGPVKRPVAAVAAPAADISSRRITA